MIIGNEDHLAIAARILSAETIRQLRQDPDLRTQGRKILGRWALNQPDTLKALEARGFLVLYSVLMNQQSLEADALTDHPDQAISEQEQLALKGIDTALVISD